jgi:hypothetical protein
MPSSISSSEPADRSVLTAELNLRYRRATIAAVALLLTVIFGAEMLSRYAFPRISQIERRIADDKREVMSTATTNPGSPPTVLLVGNSLLLRGLDYPRLRMEMAPDARVLRFAIENTEYLDWYYGLKHIFAAGVRPSTVVLCLNLGQTVSSKTLGDYSARHLFGVSELLPVAHEAGMNATRTSGLFLAHWSAFYSGRATIRNFILNKTAPGYTAALHALADAPAPPPPWGDTTVSKARIRLNAIQQLCHEYGVELVLLIPPSLSRQNEMLASAAVLQHVNLDYPMPQGTLGPEFFADGAHLNPAGAALFTDALARCLRARLEPQAQQ